MLGQGSGLGLYRFFCIDLGFLKGQDYCVCIVRIRKFCLLVDMGKFFVGLELCVVEVIQEEGGFRFVGLYLYCLYMLVF